MNMGGFTGPIVSGFIVANYDFRVATVVFFVLNSFMIVLNVLTHNCTKRKSSVNGCDMEDREDSGIEEENGIADSFSSMKRKWPCCT